MAGIRWVGRVHERGVGRQVVDGAEAFAYLVERVRAGEVLGVAVRVSVLEEQVDRGLGALHRVSCRTDESGILDLQECGDAGVQLTCHV